jgi:hypothetical protein
MDWCMTKDLDGYIHWSVIVNGLVVVLLDSAILTLDLMFCVFLSPGLTLELRNP